MRVPTIFQNVPLKMNDRGTILWNAVRDFIAFFSFIRLCMKFNTFFAFIKHHVKVKPNEKQQLKLKYHLLRRKYYISKKVLNFKVSAVY